MKFYKLSECCILDKNIYIFKKIYFNEYGFIAIRSFSRLRRQSGFLGLSIIGSMNLYVEKNTTSASYTSDENVIRV
jgi:hypothetical protein